MRESFVDSWFGSGAFAGLTGGNKDPYAAINRIGRAPTARYSIMCHQDVFADRGAGSAELHAVLKELDTVDPNWVVAGNAGVMRSGRLVRRVVDPHGESTGESLPLPV